MIDSAIKPHEWENDIDNYAKLLKWLEICMHLLTAHQKYYILLAALQELSYEPPSPNRSRLPKGILNAMASLKTLLVNDLESHRIITMDHSPPGCKLLPGEADWQTMPDGAVLKRK